MESNNSAGDRLIEIASKISLFPIVKTEKSNSKAIRITGWLITVTIWLPIFFIGMAIFIVGAFYEIYKDI